MNGLTIVPVNITEARAFVAAVDALIASVGGEYPGDRETDARDALLAAHAEAVAAAEARGRAAALAEVRLLADDVATGGDLDDFFDNVMILVDGAA